MVVASDADSLEDFVKLRDRKTQEAYQLDDSGVIITEKLASLLDVGVGDTVTITEGDRDPVQVKVTHVAENYFYHYVYMTPEVYRSCMERIRNIRSFSPSTQRMTKRLKDSSRAAIWIFLAY